MLNRNPNFIVVANSIEYPRTLYAMLNGANFGSQIARQLNKKNSTVVQQLYVLERYKLIQKTTRDKAQHYEVTEKGKRFFEIRMRYNREVDDLEK